MLRKKKQMIALLSVAALSLAACGSINIEAPTGVDRGIRDGAGADGPGQG